MSKEATREYVVRTRIRYGAMTGKRAKGRVLDEFCVTTGMERKHAIKVLRAPGDPPERRGRRPTYRRILSQLRCHFYLTQRACRFDMDPSWNVGAIPASGF